MSGCNRGIVILGIDLFLPGDSLVSSQQKILPGELYPVYSVLTLTFEAEGVRHFQGIISFSVAMGALGCWDIHLGLDCSSAAEFSGVLGLLGGIWDFPLPQSLCMGCPAGVLMALGWMWSTRQGFPPGSSFPPSHRTWHLWCLSFQVGPRSHS